MLIRYQINLILFKIQQTNLTMFSIVLSKTFIYQISTMYI